MATIQRLRIPGLITATLVAVVGFLTISVYAASFDWTTGNGFISRGDIISHPTLGKNAIDQYTANITFSKQGTHWEQNCTKTSRGSTQTNTFRQGLQNVNFRLDTRLARGSLTVSGYILTGIQSGPDLTPTNLCPTNWTPAIDSPNPVLVGGGSDGSRPPLLIFRGNSIYTGAWEAEKDVDGYFTGNWIIHVF